MHKSIDARHHRPRRRPRVTLAGMLLFGVPVTGARAAVPLPIAQTATVSAAAPAVALAAHKAVYDLSLSSTHGGGTIAASGTMSLQITDACSGGWASQQELHLQMTTREGQSNDMLSDYATLESKDGRHLTFDMRERDNGAMTQQVRGEASLDNAGAGSIRFTLPTHRTMPLPRGTLFPMAHTAAIIAAAEAGRRSIDPILFDGTSADGPSDSYVTILGWQRPPSDSSHPELAGLGSGRVHVAFFNRKTGTITPDYEVGMRYFSNGVSDRMVMDFGEFTMTGALRSFAAAKPARC